MHASTRLFVVALLLSLFVFANAGTPINVTSLLVNELRFTRTPYMFGFMSGLCGSTAALPTTPSNESIAVLPIGFGATLNLSYSAIQNADSDGFPRAVSESPQDLTNFVGRVFEGLFPTPSENLLLYDLQSASRWATPQWASRMSFQADVVTQFTAAVAYVLSQTTLVNIIVVAPQDVMLTSAHAAISQTVDKLNRLGYSASKVDSLDGTPLPPRTACILFMEKVQTAQVPVADVVFIPSWAQAAFLRDTKSTPTPPVVFLSSVPYSNALTPEFPATLPSGDGLSDDMASSLASYASPFMDALALNTSIEKVFAPVTIADTTLTDRATFYPIFLGYVDAVLFAQAVRRATFGEPFWGQTYSLGDGWQVGPFSKPCTEDISSSGLLSCNMTNGVHTVYFLNVTGPTEQGDVAGHATRLLDYTFSFPLTEPTPTSAGLSAARLHVLVDERFYPSNGRANAFAGLLVQPVSPDYLSLAASTTAMGTTDFVALGLAVSSSDSISSFPNSVFVNPVLDESLRLPNVFYLTPTIEQEINALGQAIESLYAGWPVMVFGSGAATSVVTPLLKQANVTGSITAQSTSECAGGSRRASPSGSQAYVFVVVGESITSPDAQACLKALSADDQAQIVLTMAVLASNYDFFSNTTSWPIHDTQRVLFATSLENWANASSTNNIVVAFRRLYTNATQRTPSALATYTSLSQLSSLVRVASAAHSPVELMQSMYNRAPVSNNIKLAALVSIAGNATDDSVPTMYWNALAPSLTIWERASLLPTDNKRDAATPMCTATVTASPVYNPLGTLFSPTEEPTAPPDPTEVPITSLPPDPTKVPDTTATPDTTPAPETDHGLSTSVIVAIVIIAVVVVLAAVALLLFCCCVYAENTRDNDNAPKDSDKLVAIAFTDIQSSTALWSTVPSAMSTAVVEHHKIIRRLIVKYKCYEVKTIGDSFMIASSHPFRLVQLARDLQLQLQRHKWGTSVISDVYSALATEPAGGADDAAEAHNNDFNGLRVRVGVHVGHVNVTLDEVTKGYDYYGDTVNTAARTESLASGGQTIMTEHTHASLNESEQNSITVRSLGPQALRGVPEPINMLELVVLTDRHFAALQPTLADPTGSGDAAVPLEAEENLETMLRPDAAKGASTKTASDVLNVHFAPYSTRAQIKMLRKSLKKFGIKPPKRSHFPDDETYAAQLLALAVQRTTDIVEFRREPIPEALQTFSEWSPPAARRAANPLAVPSETCVSVEVTAPESETRPREARRNRPTHSANAVCFADIEMEDIEDQPPAQPSLSPLSLQKQFGFKNGVPDVQFDEVVKCFDVGGDGMLFRLINTTSSRWAFYNDTPDLWMTVSCSLGHRSRVSVLGNTTISFDEATKRNVCHLVIPPLSTELFVEGKMNGFKFQYSAMQA